MNKLGKEAKVLLYGITITCVISFILAFEFLFDGKGISKRLDAA